MKQYYVKVDWYFLPVTLPDKDVIIAKQDELIEELFCADQCKDYDHIKKLRSELAELKANNKNL